MSNLASEVCAAEISLSVRSTDYCSTSVDSSASCIDDYYAYVEGVLKLGTPEALDSSPVLGKLMLLGLVTGVERYIRAVLAGTVRLCPVSRSHAANQQVAFGSFDFYGPDSHEWALFDSSSLAGHDEIRSRTEKMLGLNARTDSSLTSALTEFDKLCHLRHASVHTRGVLGRGNIIALGLDSQNTNLQVDLDFAQVQNAGLACHNTVRAFNRFIYESVIQRWISQKILSGDWSADRTLFRQFYNLMYSKIDHPKSANCLRAYHPLAKKRAARG